MKYDIVPFTDKHFSEALYLIVNCFTVDGNTPAQYNIQRIRKRLIASFDVGENSPSFFVAIHNNKVVGIAGSQKMDFASKTWTLFLLAVDSEYRGQGIATTLVETRIQTILDQMDEKGGRILVSTKHKKRFERMGFNVVDYDEELDLNLMLRHVYPL